MFDFLLAPISVPLWGVCVLSIGATVIGEAAVLIGFSILRSETRMRIVEGAPQSATRERTPAPNPTKQGVKRDVQSVKATVKTDVKPETKIANKTDSKSNAPISDSINISAEGLTELERRTAQKMNFKTGDAATLLGIPVGNIMKLLGAGHLKSVIGGDGVRWIQADSITNYLIEVGIVVPVEETEDENEAGSGTEEQEQEPEQEQEQSAANADPDDAPKTGDEERDDDFDEEDEEQEPEDDKEPKEPAAVKETVKATASSPSASSGRYIPQKYLYYVDGKKTPQYQTLRAAVQATGFKVLVNFPMEWPKIPARIQQRIRREPVASK